MISDEHGGQLRYCSPFHGGWDIARIALNLPESYIMFVCPASCARIIGLNAVEHHMKDRISVLGMTEDQIVTGAYEEKTLQAAVDVIGLLPHRPRVFILFMSCIDSLLGTDHTVWLEELSALFPDIRFLLMRMSPISRDSGELPLVQLQTDLYALLTEKPLSAQPGVGIIGPNMMLSEDNELVQAITGGGFIIRHLHEMERFDEFLEFSANVMNLPNVPFGMKAAALLHERFGSETEPLIQNYDFDTYQRIEHRICSFLEIKEPDYKREREHTEEVLRETSLLLSGTKLLIDSSATLMPLTLAVFFIKYGFMVDCVYVDSTKPQEVQALQWLTENASDVKIVDSGSYQIPGKREYEPQDCLAIGMEASCYGKSTYTLNLFYENTMWGFAGIRQLCRLMLEAVKRRCSVDELLIKEKALSEQNSLSQTARDARLHALMTYDTKLVSAEKGLSVLLPPFAPDYGGACEVFYELGGLTIIHDAAGCTINYTTYDEPRWLSKASALYCSGLREIEAVLGDDSVIVKKAEQTAKELGSSFIAIVGSSVPMLIGTDFEGIATELENRTGLPCFGIKSTGIHLYDWGAGIAMEQLVRRFCGDREESIRHGINLCGVIPMDYHSEDNVEAVKSRFEQAGYTVVACMTMGCTIEALKKAQNAELNVVMSSCGLRTAVYMKEKYGIPYLCGVPVGEEQSKVLWRRMAAAMEFTDETVVPSAGGRLGKKEIEEEHTLCQPKAQAGTLCESTEKNRHHVLIIGEAITSLSLAETYRLDNAFDSVTVINPFTPILRSVYHEMLWYSDCHYIELSSETEIAWEINSGRYDYLDADPVFRMLLFGDMENSIKVIDRPSVSVSGGIFR